ncbi:hypothetical protein [Mesobacillus zeae]|uniref:hypothetical protein n=1 Tax=Mesobacillus zeae TaxID=1917180 RepID=UPI003009B276
MKTVEIFEHLFPGQILSNVMNHIQNYIQVDECEFQPTVICLVGNRIKGAHSSNSDLNIALQYRGRLREDDCFTALMNYPLFIDEIKVDFTPFHEDKGRTINLSEHNILLFEEEEEYTVDYNSSKMQRLVEQDSILLQIFNDLKKKNVPQPDALRVLFNGFVLDDSAMIEAYSKA